MSVTDEIKARIDAVDLISRYVPLQRSGRTYKACCPFHEERTPSFVVFPDTGTWRCFGACGTGGDIFSFFMAKENLPFADALKQLASEAGVELDAGPENEERRERVRLYEVNAAAAQFYRNLLHRHPDAQVAREYLQTRGINAEIAEYFQLGFAPRGWDHLRIHLLEQGFSLELQEKAGVLKKHAERESYYDAFRNRLMIPIPDRQGRIIGFGGRVLGDDVPKYLNTAETPLFHKSAVVYGLDRSGQAIRKADTVVIVEGYMDVIAAHQYGFENVVACLGTSLTEDQLRQIQRFTDNYVLALDADSAGQQATIRGLNQARQALRRKEKPVVTASGQVRVEARLGTNLRIAALPEGMDPDDILRKDPDLWRSLVKNAQPLVDYYIGVVATQVDLESAAGKAAAVAELAPLVAELGDEIERQHYVQRISRLVHIDEQTIDHRVQSAARALRERQGQKRRSRYTRNRSENPAADRVESPAPEEADTTQPSEQERQRQESEWQETQLQLETYLLANLLDEPNLLVWLAGATAEREMKPLSADDLQQVEYRELFEALKRFMAGDEIWDIESFQDGLEPHLQGRLADLLGHAAQLPEREPKEIREAILKVIVRMRRERLVESLNAMQFLLQDAQQNRDREAILGYSAAINGNRRERQHLDRVLARLNRAAYGTVRVDEGVRIA